ncbi:MAG: hypothetical protein ACYC5M_14685 [Anaerolineae bacterium]
MHEVQDNNRILSSTECDGYHIYVGTALFVLAADELNGPLGKCIQEASVAPGHFGEIHRLETEILDNVFDGRFLVETPSTRFGDKVATVVVLAAYSPQ